MQAWRTPFPYDGIIRCYPPEGTAKPPRRSLGAVRTASPPHSRSRGAAAAYAAPKEVPGDREDDQGEDAPAEAGEDRVDEPDVLPEEVAEQLRQTAQTIAVGMTNATKRR